MYFLAQRKLLKKQKFLRQEKISYEKKKILRQEKNSSDKKKNLATRKKF